MMESQEKWDSSCDTGINETSTFNSEQYKKKMQRRKEIQEKRTSQASLKKGLIIVHTGNGKEKQLLL
ncbi:Cob(I)alamin adenosyltransferase [Richelia intracellularis HM01]|nr:Cob(I)alamin adenosyltransferase [Richelia intracellularis HM01]